MATLDDDARSLVAAPELRIQGPEAVPQPYAPSAAIPHAETF